MERDQEKSREIRRDTRPLLCQRTPQIPFPVSPGGDLCPPLRDMGGHWDLPGQAHSSCLDSPVPHVGHGLSPLHSCDLNLENISGTALGCL